MYRLGPTRGQVSLQTFELDQLIIVRASVTRPIQILSRFGNIIYAQEMTTLTETVHGNLNQSGQWFTNAT